MAGVVSLVLDSLDLAVAQTIGLVEADRDLLLDGEGHCEYHFWSTNCAMPRISRSRQWMQTY